MSALSPVAALWRLTYGNAEGDLNLSYRTAEAMRRARLDVVQLGDLVQYTEARLLAKDGIGQTTLNEIKTRLAAIGLSLGMKRSAPAVRGYIKARYKERAAATAKLAEQPFLQIRYRVLEWRGRSLKPFGLYLHDVAKGKLKRGDVIMLRWCSGAEAYQARIEAVEWPFTLCVRRVKEKRSRSRSRDEED